MSIANSQTIEKLKRLATDPAAPPGEREGAIEALKRKGTVLDLVLVDIPLNNESIEPLALNEITLTPLMMITPTAECIYAPSRIAKPHTFTLKEWLGMGTLTMSVSLADDGKSNPQKMTCYAGNGGYWMAQ